MENKEEEPHPWRRVRGKGWYRLVVINRNEEERGGNPRFHQEESTVETLPRRHYLVGDIDMLDSDLNPKICGYGSRFGSGSGRKI